MTQECPGIPEECDHARRVFSDAMNGFVSAPQLDALRAEIAHCTTCVGALDLELQFRSAMSSASHQQAPSELRNRISTALASVDLSQIEVTDL